VAADIRIVIAGLRFKLRVLPLVFWPLQPIDFIGYSARLICGVAPRVQFELIPAGAQHPRARGGPAGRIPSGPLLSCPVIRLGEGRSGAALPITLQGRRRGTLAASRTPRSVTGPGCWPKANWRSTPERGFRCSLIHGSMDPSLCRLLHNTQIGYGCTRHGLRIMPPTHSQQFVDFKEEGF
jgi:hypothetical protein